MRAAKIHLWLTVLLAPLFFAPSSNVMQDCKSGRPDDCPRKAEPRPDNSRSEKPPAPPPATPPKVVKPSPRKPDPRANITLTVYPTDSRVTLDTKETNPPDSRGVVMFTNLTLTTHQLIVRRAGYRDHSMVFSVHAGVNPPLSVKLEPLPGMLQVFPSVAEARIEINRVDGQRDPVTRVGTIDGVELPPGEYEIRVSKTGYTTSTRTIHLTPAHTLSLEPKLEPVVVRKPPPPERRVVMIPVTSTVETSGKFLVVRIRGASAETANAGSINVLAGKDAAGMPDIKGSLSGRPCEVEFVRLANVAEASLLEAPGPSNQWSTVAIRVRPKDVKRQIHFVINWRSLEKSAAVQ